MKGIPSVALILALAALSSACAGKTKMESEWNRLGLWHQVASDPPTYIPEGYPTTRPRSTHDGTWFTDRRDGKRFFVPQVRVNGFDHEVLETEARKITGTPRPRTPRSISVAAEDMASTMLKAVVLVGAGMAH